MDFYTVTELSPADLTAEHQHLIVKVLNKTPPAARLKAILFILETLAFSGGYDVKSKRKLVKSANKLLISLAELGDAESQCVLGEHYINYRMTPLNDSQNAVEAVKWLEKSYKQGYGRAAYNLSYIYEKGRKGIEQDLHKAAYYEKRAVELGYES